MYRFSLISFQNCSDIICFPTKTHILIGIAGIEMLNLKRWVNDLEEVRSIYVAFTLSYSIMLLFKDLRCFIVTFSLSKELDILISVKKCLPCCIKHRCARQCFQRHSGRKNPPRRRGGAPDAASYHSDRPEWGWTDCGGAMERERERERERDRGQIKVEKNKKRFMWLFNKEREREAEKQTRMKKTQWHTERGTRWQL